MLPRKSCWNGAYDGHGLRAAAVAVAGLLLPEVLVAENLASGRLVRALQAYAPEPRPVHLVYRQDRRPLPKPSGFVEHLLAQVPTFVPASAAQ
ncbi:MULTISPECIES: LysR substrate-binding domain-containing protein [Ralstonia]|uniref:LysR substrate-binding domain-containing protein n=1 Tax=Ralstonia TaxID=48736 RepID=UPI00237886E8|nr:MULTISPECIES: LysR substrate-binding domain-containing protein [Ralstonia]MDR9385904.1 LysR substrate-binding domain-containing protein [Ralstonia sp. 11b]